MEIKGTEIKCISPEEIAAGLKEHTFWYVYNEDKQEIIAHPKSSSNGWSIFLFQEQEDAENWRYIAVKMLGCPDKTLTVHNEIFQVLYEEVLENEEFQVFPINHENAEKIFALDDYQAIFLTREIEKARPDDSVSTE